MYRLLGAAMSGDLEALKAEFKQTLKDFEYDVRETEPAETT